ncbi:hypothetical protein BD410DRAFT_308329 [Rickenella mellea]|uniref:F-box domain-containing protein n=1 Tax=Rickenella mellea TaxID=50990 RepID=A0A4Y7Q0Q2_9AGAM|nr:hypothetical protein BD410DRAFT_308329 [Rickenella mellea]
MSSGHLSSFLNAIEEARVCMKALNEAQRRLGKRLRCLRRLSQPFVLEEGIKRLPNEVLAVIFEMAHYLDGEGPVQFALCVSHVSRRFRNVALATPLLWTTIHDSFGENQIREFISRSGRLDLNIKMPYSTDIECFLKVIKGTSHRWSSLSIIEQETEYVMMKLGMTDLPRLRYLSYAFPVELTIFSTPRLSQVVGWGCLFKSPAGSYLLSNLTHVEFRLYEEDESFKFLATTLHSMKNLQDLSFLLEGRTGEDILLSDNAAYPKPHSVHIDRLAISIVGNMQDYSAPLFDVLIHLRPSTVELSINSNAPYRHLLNSKGEFFPYGSTIKFEIPQTIDVTTTLVNLVQNWDIVRTVHFDTPMAHSLSEWRQNRLHHDDWERIRSLDTLRFMNCDKFSESDIEAFTTKLFQTEAENGPRSLEIVSCKLISEDFLLGLHDEVGDRLKWTI